MLLFNEVVNLQSSYSWFLCQTEIHLIAMPVGRWPTENSLEKGRILYCPVFEDYSSGLHSDTRRLKVNSPPSSGYLDALF